MENNKTEKIFGIFDRNKYIILDGAMGTMLQKNGLKMGEIPELLNIKNPQLITSIHKQYLDAGSDIVYANTFGANRKKMANTGYSVDEIITSGIICAKNATKQCKKGKVAVSIGPIGELLEPHGSLSCDEEYDMFKEMAVAAEKAGADLAVVETITDLQEARMAVLAVKENTSLPILCTMSFEKNMRTFTGCHVSNFGLTIEGLGADAVGINCSLGPKEILPIAKELRKWTSLPIAIKANAGLPNPKTSLYDIDATDFRGFMEEYLDIGINIIGGCCGTTPEYIGEVWKLTMNKSPKYVKQESFTAVCSSSETVVIDCPKIVGERINPTGKKLFKQALINDDIDYIVKEAITQWQNGADILDINVGLADIDEKEMMKKVIKRVTSSVSLPLQIDSSNKEAIEAGLRLYCGRAILNSVNGEEKNLDALLPIAKKYGSLVVGLTLDEKGLPKTCDERVAIAKRIVEKCDYYGMKRKDIFIDCLTLTVSAEQSQAMETLRAIKEIKSKFGVKTILGVSNISFGLPNREVLNHNFLTMALCYGLDLAIINPNIKQMTDAVSTYNVFTGLDKNCEKYIERQTASAQIQSPKEQIKSADMTLDIAVIKGLQDESRCVTKQLLGSGADPMEIINNVLIPALDKVGESFEKGTIFLPQLISSANCASVCFDEIKRNIQQSKENQIQQKGKIVVATVKGDIHDIGKNIVKVILENYGYEIVDLGR
ncbi:MAG: homocysteine S-methyltransferase family protein, partial [Oscillospiraceae bacterium]